MLSIDLGHGDECTARRPDSALDERLAATLRYYEAHSAAYAAATDPIDTSGRLGEFSSLLPRGGRVLDAGCGGGRDLLQLRRAGLRPVGLDLSPALAKIARARSGCEVVVGDLRAPGLEPGSFDGVWAMASLLHLDRAQVDDALLALVGLLRDGGVMFTSVKRGTGETSDDTGRWFTLYDEGEWAARLVRAGLQVIDTIGEPQSDGTATGSVAPEWISSLARLR